MTLSYHSEAQSADTLKGTRESRPQEDAPCSSEQGRVSRKTSRWGIRFAAVFPAAFAAQTVDSIIYDKSIL